MSHIVIHDDNDNITRYRRFDDVADAVAYLEELHNAETATGAQLFAMSEVEFAVTSYVKVEIPAAAPAVTALIAAETAAVETTPSGETMLAGETVRAGETVPADDVETVEYVEAAMAPGNAFTPATPAPIQDVVTESTPNGEVRRGLFGR